MNRKQEVEAVKQFGECIGYGNMMHIASALWAKSLKEKYGINSGAFIPTLSFTMKKKQAERALKHREVQIREFESL